MHNASKFWSIKFMDANFSYYSIYDRFIQRQPCACVCVHPSTFALTLSQMTNFRPFQTDRVCRQQFKFYENGTSFSRWVENTVGKGEIARYKQFLLFPQCFQKDLFCRHV